MFLRIQESTSTDAPTSEKRYEAIWFLGYDPVSEKYVLHLFDVFGARFSETLGYGGVAIARRPMVVGGGSTPQPAARACSMYQRVASSLPTGR